MSQKDRQYEFDPATGFPYAVGRLDSEFDPATGFPYPNVESNRSQWRRWVRAHPVAAAIWFEAIVFLVVLPVLILVAAYVIFDLNCAPGDEEGCGWLLIFAITGATTVFLAGLAIIAVTGVAAWIVRRRRSA